MLYSLSRFFSKDADRLPYCRKKYADNSSDDKQEEMMSMTRRSATRKRPAGAAALRSDVVQTDTSARTSGGFTTLLASATQQILAVTYWFDTVPHPGPYPVTVRFTGRRVDVKGRLSSGDRLVQDETIEEVIPGSGPISLTARVRGINAGEWVVTAHMLESATSAQRSGEKENVAPAAGSLRPAARLWRRWAPSVGSV